MVTVLRSAESRAADTVRVALAPYFGGHLEAWTVRRQHLSRQVTMPCHVDI